MSTNPSDDTIDYPQPTVQALQPRPPAEKAVVDAAAKSHPGIVRPRNEDIYLVARFIRSMQTVRTNMPPGFIPDEHADDGYALLVADGVGGMTGGDVASRTAVAALIRLVIETPDWIMRIGHGEADDVLGRIVSRYRAIDEELRER